jgi:hypothetical protein
MLGSEDTQQPDGTSWDDVLFEAGWLGGAQMGYWFTPRIGLRANGTYSERPIVSGNINVLDPNSDDTDVVKNLNLWSGSGDLMFRLKTPAEEFTKMEMLPYLALGLGAKWHNSGQDRFMCQEPTDNEQYVCDPIYGKNPDGTPSSLMFGLGELKGIMGLVGLGADWRLGRNIALRTEISDRIYRPKLKQIQATTDAETFTVISDGNVSQTVHEVAGQIGLHFLFGVARPMAVAVAPAPTAPSAPPVSPTPVTPTPTPAPREDMITVCVIDPTVNGGIRSERAVFLPASGDTMFTVNGQRVLMRNAIGNVMVASNADWYVRGQPLAMTVGGERIEFVTTGTPRMVEGSDLAFLGTINGLPVYADRDDVADVREELAELNRAQRGTDLAKILEEHKELREQLEDVSLVYVPLQPTGCVFQAVQRQEQVRKNR